MQSWHRTLLRSLLLASVLIGVAAFLFSNRPMGGTDFGTSRLVAKEALPYEGAGENCTWETASPLLPKAVGYQAAGAGAVASDAASRTPVRTIRDPYAGFSAIRVDTVHNEVVIMDEFKFHIYVYDRLAKTPDSADHTEPKREIGGYKTMSRYNSDGYVDPKTGDIYIVNNDSEPGMYVYSREKNGNVSPNRGLVTPYGGFGLTVDEQREEMFVTVQHDGAIMVWPKYAKEKDGPIRLIQGDKTQMGDPHGIAIDEKARLLYVANYGTSRLAEAGTVQQLPTPLNTVRPPTQPRVANWPAGNFSPYRLRHEVVPGTGKFGPPSITVFSADAQGNVAPVRRIVGPKAQLNWPTGVSIDTDRQEIFVANAAGDSINVFKTSQDGDVAPIRVIKGPRTMLRNPNGVAVDMVNHEVWVANYGNHTATAYKSDANGNVEPVRVIRSAPLKEPTTLISNPFMIAFDNKRDEVLVPNCVGQPRISAWPSSANKNVVPARIIEGQNTHLNRTVHAIAYDDIHDEIVVQSNIGQAILTFRGGANGDEAPIRVIQGAKTNLRDPVSIFIDPANNEIYAINMQADDTLLVFDRTAIGDVAPKRILKGASGVGAVDPVTNLLFVSGGGGVKVFNRTAEGTTPPLRTIGGGDVSGVRGINKIMVYPPARKIIVTTQPRGGGGGRRGPGAPADAENDANGAELQPTAFAAVFNEEDSGDVAPVATIAKGYIYMPRGLTFDAKHKTILLSDKYLNAVMTFSLPELFTASSPKTTETARAGH